MDDRQRMEALRQGKPQAMDELLARYGGLLRYVIGGILSHPQEAEDCFSEVCLLLWQKAGCYDPAKGPLAPG